jgi:hypothetical protein
VELTEKAKKLLTKIASETSLRYAINLLTTSSLVAAKRKAPKVDMILEFSAIFYLILFRLMSKILRVCMKCLLMSAVPNSTWKRIKKTTCSLRGKLQRQWTPLEEMRYFHSILNSRGNRNLEDASNCMAHFSRASMTNYCAHSYQQSHKSVLK